MIWWFKKKINDGYTQFSPKYLFVKGDGLRKYISYCCEKTNMRLLSGKYKLSWMRLLIKKIDSYKYNDPIKIRILV